MALIVDLVVATCFDCEIESRIVMFSHSRYGEEEDRLKMNTNEERGDTHTYNHEWSSSLHQADIRKTEYRP